MASVTYRISGKADNKAINEAQKALQSLGKVANGVSNVFKGFVAVKALGAIKDVASGSMTAFSESQASFTRLFQSVNNNSKLTEGAFKRLTASANAFQKTTLFDADDLNKNQRFLSDMKLSEEQIDSTMKAAMDMAASGVMPLEQAVQTLGKTYTGSAGQLGKMNGEIKSLTKEQLKNGDAVKIMAKQYKGMSEVMANTTLGRTTRINIALGDIKETLGQIPAGLQLLSFDKLMKGLDTFKKGLDEGINVLFIAFENLPEAGKIVFEALGQMFAKVFSWDFIGSVLTITINQMGRMFTALFEGLKAGFNAIWETASYNKDLKKNIESTTIKRNSAYGAVGAKEKELEKKGIVNDYWKRADGSDNPEYTAEMKAVKDEYNKVALELKKLQDIEQRGYGEAVWQGIETSLKKATEGTKESFNELGSLLNDNFSDILTGIPEKIKALSPDGKSTTIKSLNTPTGTTPTIPTPDEGSGGLMSAMGGLSGLIGMFGQLGQAINCLMSGNPLGILVQIITSFIGMFAGIENAGKVMNLFTTIFERTGEIIGPIVNTMLAPLVDILGQIGTLVGVHLAPIFKVLGEMLLPIFHNISVVLQILIPISSVISQLIALAIRLSPALNLVMAGFTLLANGLTFIFNKILTPIINFVIKLITGVGNLIIGLFNGIVNILKSINIFGWRPFGGMSTVGQLNYDEMKLSEITATTEETTNSKSTSSAASYTAVRDLTVNIYYNDSYVNGDERKIALNIRDVIKAAERLGY